MDKELGMKYRKITDEPPLDYEETDEQIDDRFACKINNFNDNGMCDPVVFGTSGTKGAGVKVFSDCIMRSLGKVKREMK